MSYFDDFQLLNVTNVRMYGAFNSRIIRTPCHYMGIMCGNYMLTGHEEERPIVYMTPQGITTSSGWQSPAGKFRDNFYIECTGERADRFFASMDVIDRSHFFFISDPAPFIAKLQEIQRLFTAGNPCQKYRIVLCFEEFAAMLLEDLRYSQNPALHRFRLEELLAAINHNPNLKWDFAHYAEKAGITLRHWNRVFTAVTGMPPHRLVSSCRIKLARELLTQTTLTVKEIAAKCGFENTSEFSRFFRKNTAITPGECRRSRQH